MRNRSIAFLAAAILLSASSVLAQNGEYEAAGRSNLTSVSLPTGALRLFQNHVPTEVGQTLDTIIAQGGGKFRRGDTEVIVWTGRDLQKAGAEQILGRLAGALKGSGWQYEISGTENGLSIFTILKDGAQRRAIVGFHGVADGTLVLAWTEIEAATAEPAATNSTDAPGGAMPDYSFTTPPGWTKADRDGRILLTRDGDKSLAFLPLMETSGDLARDADRILWQVLKGFNTWHGNGFTPDYGTFERGRTAQGLEYFQAFRYAKKASDPNEGLIQSRFDAIILLVKVGDKVAVVVGRQPFQSSPGPESALGAIDLILYDLTFKSVADKYDLKSELLGSWSAASGSVGLAYTFNANGSFNKGGAIQFRVSHDARRDKVTTTSYGMTETYKLAGNILTQTYKNTGEVSRSRVRIFETKYDKDPWRKKLGLWSLERTDGDTIVMSRSE